MGKGKNYEIEIEYKFLIENTVGLDELIEKYGGEKRTIHQTYLVAEGNGEARVRMVVASDGSVKYTYTQKYDVERSENNVNNRFGPKVRKEIEGSISKDTYESFLYFRNSGTLVKNRYIIKHKKHKLEIDEYINIDTGTVLEIEIKQSEKMSLQEIKDILPDEIVIIEDVSKNSDYSNKNLAKLVKEH